MLIGIYNPNRLCRHKCEVPERGHMFQMILDRLCRRRDRKNHTRSNVVRPYNYPFIFNENVEVSNLCLIRNERSASVITGNCVKYKIKNESHGLWFRKNKQTFSLIIIMLARC